MKSGETVVQSKFQAKMILNSAKKLLLLFFPLRRLSCGVKIEQEKNEVEELEQLIAKTCMELKLGKNVHEISQISDNSQLQFLFKYSQNLGTPLVQVLEIVDDILTDVRELEVSKVSALAMPKATVKLLRFLPLVGILLGYILGANPIATLLTSPSGLISLSIGLVFMLVGNKWTTSIVRDFEKDEVFSFENDPRILLALVKVAVKQGSSLIRALEALNVQEIENLKRGIPFTHANLPEYIQCLEDSYNSGGSPVSLINMEIKNRNVYIKKKYKTCAEKLTVELVVPLGLCYLPSFICIGVVPIIISFLG
ncbi:MAG: hypothetical protein LBI63_01155 [Candidatus Ancillula sp.]|jgi:tight adherence protein B|nr:hypothetical protein [Candidatus Ancillula sp.]